MIVTGLESPGGPSLLVVTQADHARLASDLLRLVRLPELVEHPRREALLRAVAEHDNGWWEEDSAARLDGAGTGPVDFRRLPDESRREIWRRGVARFSAEAPYVAAMVAGHALRLLASRRGSDPEWDRFLSEIEAEREELADLLEASGDASRSELAADDDWLAVADELALAAATGDARFVSRAGWTAAAGTEQSAAWLAVAPFPWAGATRFELSCRRIEARRHASDVELGRALATARWERLPIRLSPLEGRATPERASRAPWQQVDSPSGSPQR